MGCKMGKEQEPETGKLAPAAESAVEPLLFGLGAGLLSPLLTPAKQVLELLTQLESTCAPSSTELRQRLSISDGYSITDRWLLIGVSLALEQPEFKRPFRQPKRSRGKPKGSRKPIMNRGSTTVRDAVAGYNEVMNEFAQSYTYPSNVSELAGIAMRVTPLLPAAFDANASGADLRTLVEAAGGVRRVAATLGTDENTVLRSIETEKQWSHYWDRRKEAEKKAKDQAYAIIAEASALSEDGIDRVETDQKSLRRILKAQVRDSLARALVGDGRTK